MGLITLLFSNPVLFLILAVVLLYSVIIHEVAHGWVAHLFGDETAKYAGRLTLNPASHIDPVGTLLLFIVGFGWAKPVPISYAHFENRRFGFFSVALAGCAANIFIAMLALCLLQVRLLNANPLFSVMLPIVVKINIILGAFNLIPIPPLDGSKILMSFLPRRAQEYLSRIEPYGFFILAILLYTGLLDPAISFMQRIIYFFIAIVFSYFWR